MCTYSTVYLCTALLLLKICRLYMVSIIMVRFRVIEDQIFFKEKKIHRTYNIWISLFYIAKNAKLNFVGTCFPKNILKVRLGYSRCTLYSIHCSLYCIGLLIKIDLIVVYSFSITTHHFKAFKVLKSSICAQCLYESKNLLKNK